VLSLCKSWTLSYDDEASWMQVNMVRIMVAIHLMHIQNVALILLDDVVKTAARGLLVMDQTLFLKHISRKQAAESQVPKNVAYLWYWQTNSKTTLNNKTALISGF